MEIEQRIGENGKPEYALLYQGEEVCASPEFDEILEMYENFNLDEYNRELGGGSRQTGRE